MPFLAWMCVAIGALVVVLLSEHGRRARHEHAGIVIRMGAIAIVYTIAFPLGTDGPASAAVGVGAVGGLLMLFSGTSNVIGPLGGAAIASVLGDRWVHGIIIGLCLATAGWLSMLPRERGGC